jgi:hypothetical protein
MEYEVKIETRTVDIPNVGPMFRRAWKTTDGEELRVEYMPMVYGEVVVVSEVAKQTERNSLEPAS